MLELKQVVLDADVAEHGHFVFADGAHSLIKLEMDNLWRHPASLEIILDHLARADGLPDADVILGVPSGGQRLAAELVRSHRLTTPIALLERVPGSHKRHYRFSSAADQALAQNAKSVRIYEDVVSTLSSVASVINLLNPHQQRIHSLAIWRRGTIKPQYSAGLTDHYLIEDVLPSFPPDKCPHPTHRTV